VGLADSPDMGTAVSLDVDTANLAVAPADTEIEAHNLDAGSDDMDVLSLESDDNMDYDDLSRYPVVDKWFNPLGQTEGRTLDLDVGTTIVHNDVHTWGWGVETICLY
jgi:hypothetical protein